MPRDPEKHDPNWGGRRPNQTGRPQLPSRRMRVGTLYLHPDTVKALADRAEDGETLIQVAARVLTSCLSS